MACLFWLFILILLFQGGIKIAFFGFLFLIAFSFIRKF